MRCLAPALLALTLNLPVVLADTPPRTVTRLTWEAEPGAEECITGAELEAAVATRLGRPAFAPDGSLHILGRIGAGPDGRGFVVVLELHQESGEVVGRRELRTSSGQCRRLDESIAVVLALLVEAGREVVTLQVPDAPPEPEPVVAADPPPPPPPDPLARRWSIALALGASVSWGSLPGAALGWGGALEWRSAGPFGVRAEVMIEPGAETRFDETRGARFSSMLGGLALCADASVGPLDLGGCLGARSGRLRGTGFGFTESGSATVPWLSAQALARARWRVELGRSSLFAELAGGLGVPVLRDGFTVQPGGVSRVAHRPAAVVPSVALALGVRL